MDLPSLGVKAEPLGVALVKDRTDSLYSTEWLNEHELGIKEELPVVDKKHSTPSMCVEPRDERIPPMPGDFLHEQKEPQAKPIKLEPGTSEDSVDMYTTPIHKREIYKQEDLDSDRAQYSSAEQCLSEVPFPVTFYRRQTTLTREELTEDNEKITCGDSNCIPNGDDITNMKSSPGNTGNRVYTNDKPYQCLQCDYKSSRKGDLVRHVRKHTGEKPYKCSHCDYRSASSGNRASHERTHTMKKPYECSHDDYRSASHGDHVRHMRTHTGEKPYRCQQCDFQCVYHSALTIHIRTHTGDKPYKCAQCDYKSVCRSDLVKHTKRHTYRCSQCDYTSGRKDAVVKHARKHTYTREAIQTLTL